MGAGRVMGAWRAGKAENGDLLMSVAVFAGSFHSDLMAAN